MADHFWVDTNIVIRHITGEPKHHAKTVHDMMQLVDEGSLVLHIHPMVIAECCYVLEGVYEFMKQDIAKALKFFLDSDGIEAEEKDIVDEALLLYGDKNVDFEDAYLATFARKSSLKAILTFDSKHFKRLEGEHYTPSELLHMR